MDTLELQNELVSCIAHFTRLRDICLTTANGEVGRISKNLKSKSEAKADHYQRCAQRLVDRYNRITKEKLNLNTIH